MIIDKLPKEMLSLISQMIDITVRYDAINIRSIFDKIDELSDQLNSITIKTADKYIKKEEFEVAAEIYSLTPKTLISCANLIENKNTDISELLKSNAVTWSLHVNTMLDYALNSSIQKAHKFESDKNYKECAEYKNKAKALEYQIQNDTGSKEIENFIKKKIKENMQKTSVEKEIQKQKKQIDKMLRHSRYISTTEKTNKDLVTPDQIIIKQGPVELSKKGKGFEWYNWSIYLKPAKDNTDILNKIDYVTYTLHPTFYRPMRRIYDSTDGFRLNATEWGEFEIKVDIQYKKGQTLTKYHWLQLDSSAK